MPYIFRLLQTYSRKEKWWKLWEKRTGTLKGWKFELTWKIVCIHCFKVEYLDVSLYERSDFLKIIWCYLFCMLCSWLLSGFRLFVLICNVKVKPIINKLRQTKLPEVQWLSLLWCKFFVDYYDEIQYCIGWRQTLTCFSC